MHFAGAACHSDTAEFESFINSSNNSCMYIGSLRKCISAAEGLRPRAQSIQVAHHIVPLYVGNCLSVCHTTAVHK